MRCGSAIQKHHMQRDYWREEYCGHNKDPNYALVCQDVQIHDCPYTEGMLLQSFKKDWRSEGRNALESLLISKVLSECSEHNSVNGNISYLPFLANLFTKDAHTLARQPNYFLEELRNFLTLYSFLYLCQLTINLARPRFRYEKPTARCLYFILENERASKERHECSEFGFNYIFSKSRGLAYRVFPYLGYFNRVLDVPCWVVGSEDLGEEYLVRVNEFNRKLANLFGEHYQESVSIEEAFNVGVDFHMRMFEETLSTSKKGSRKGRNKNVVDTFEKNFCAGFISDRKAAGKYFVLNSTILLLLTNLVIGDDDKMLIDDVVSGFKERGVWLDLKSRDALLKFYENVGNVEKLSDSGDAVYVRSTI